MPLHDFPVFLAQQADAGFLTGALRGALVGAVLGALIGVVIAIFRKTKDRGPEPKE